MNSLPKDPVILLSYINTQLRDNFTTLSDLCRALMVNEADVTKTLKNINYEYDKMTNQFI